MKLKHLLVSASAAACLVWPAAVLADPPADRGGKPDQQGQQHEVKAKPRGGGAAADAGARKPAPTPAPTRTAPDHGGAKPAAHAGPSGPTPPPSVNASRPARTAPQRPSPPSGPVNPRPPVAVHASPAGPAPQIKVGPATRPGRKPPANTPRLSDWNRTVRGPDRDQAGQQWRQGHANWDSRSPWRSNPNWWRGNASFRLFLGPRIGFFFIPDFGYVRAPSQYEKHYWRTGEVLPNWFWRYEVRQYWRYALPQPPDGCIWVWVDNDVALIDASDGYILDIVHNAW